MTKAAFTDIQYNGKPVNMKIFVKRKKKNLFAIFKDLKYKQPFPAKIRWRGIGTARVSKLNGVSVFAVCCVTVIFLFRQYHCFYSFA